MDFGERARRLVEQALSDTCMVPVAPGSCLMVNAAAQELEECGEAALPFIEQGIRDGTARATPMPAGYAELLRKHIGLLDIWVAYYRAGYPTQPGRVFDFLGSLDAPLLATAILAMRYAWPKREGAIMVPAALLTFADELGQLHGGEVAEVVGYLRR